jgi:lactoylglutathione lyase
MIPVHGLFEAHLSVTDLSRAMAFYGGTLGFRLALEFPERKVAFYWLGGRGHSMLGLWEVGTAPQRLSLHVAFQVDLAEVLMAPQRLRANGVEPLDFSGNPCEQPDVLTWMPAAAVYFRDPDGNLLEFLAMLPEPPAPALGVVDWNAWTNWKNSTSRA